MKPEATDILQLIRKNPNLYVILAATTVDTNNESLLNYFKGFHNVNRDITKAQMSRVGDSWFINYLTRENLPWLVAWQETQGYWEGKPQPNSYVILADNIDLNKVICELQANLAQDSILVFKANTPYKTFKKPEEYCTKVDNKWIRYDLIDAISINCPLLESTKRFFESIIDDKFPVNLDKESLDRDDIYYIAYNEAPDFYNAQAFQNTHITKEDFVFEVVLLVVEMWDNGLLTELTPQNAINKIRALIKTKIFNDIRRANRKDYPDMRLDRDFSGKTTDDNRVSGVDLLHHKQLKQDDSEYIPWILAQKETQPDFKGYHTPEELEEATSTIERRGLDILFDIIDKFSMEPYIDSVHGSLNFFKRTVVKMLLRGYTTLEITQKFLPAETLQKGRTVDPRVLPANDTGVGTRTSKFVRDVHKDLTEYIQNELTQEDRWTLEEYLVNFQKYALKR